MGNIATIDTLAGGMISLARRVQGQHGSVIVKQCVSRSLPTGLYELEALGLQTMAAAPGGPRVPRVIAVADTWIVLEDCGTAIDQASPTDKAWENFGRSLAAMHACTAPRFGFSRDNYLGVIAQNNEWTDDGVSQWVDRRVLHYLDVPLFQQWTTTQDRAALQCYADVARREIPPQPPSLLHGDLWHANVLTLPGGNALAMIDPAVYYGLAESEISLTQQWGHFPERFLAAYNEAHPLPDGWRQRLELYYIAQIVGIIAHVGNQWDMVNEMRKHLQKFIGQYS